ncbi:MAG TPA: helix-turn-helix domain-containing protein [Thermoanaerobaculia bacterium]|nr:helix-turn-helix domain-containing protein [Thermoanaerobaculia bacterium]HMF07771.1 helix-turn-helix domain-containing protein [Thermoanaerobaculia bacterium]
MIPGADLRFGEELRRERLAREISLEEISAATKISMRLLTALEASDLKRLPAPAFTRGFIRSYAQHIGIDPEEKICAYLAELNRNSNGSAPVIVPGRRRFWRGRGTTAGMIVGGVTALLLVLGLIAKPQRHGAVRLDVPVPARASRAVALKNVTISSEPTPAVRQPEVAPAASSAPASDGVGGEAVVSLVLEFDQDSWTKLDTAEGTVFSGLIRRGEVKRFESRGGFRLTLGNAGGVRATVNGQAVQSLGRAGQVVRDLPIPPPAARG